MGFQIVDLTESRRNIVITGGLVPKGTYNASTTYAIGDAVEYSTHSHILHTLVVAGTAPTNKDYWQQI